MSRCGCPQRDLGQRRCDLTVTALGRVLIPHCRVWRGVTQPSHEFSQRRAHLGSQRGPGMAQAMNSQIGSTGSGTRFVVMPIERRRSQVPAALGRKQQSVGLDLHVGIEVGLDGGHQVRRDGDVTDTRITLGGGDLISPFETGTFGGEQLEDRSGPSCWLANCPGNR